MLKNGKLLLSSLLIIFLLSVTVLGAYFYRYQVYTPLNPGSQVKVNLVIKKGEKGAQIAKELTSAGLIRSPLFFRLYLRFSNQGSGLVQAGEYKLSPNLSLAEIVKQLKHGTFDLKLTFVEGWRKEEDAFYLRGVFGREFAKAFLADPQAEEGYLFPDTYFVQQSITPSQLVSLLRSNFDKKVDSKLRQEFNKQGLSLAKAVTLASIVEREARQQKDRALVAGILIKRLKNNLPLEADATTQYAKANITCLDNFLLVSERCKWWPQELTASDLELSSPFNTRVASNLPPSAIANPGLSSLQAVAAPQESRYWYYLSDSQGRVYYSKTLDEHNEKIGMYLKPQ